MAKNNKKEPVELPDLRPEAVVGNEQYVVARNLGLLQKHLGYTNEEMAKIFGVSRSYYERLKSGKNALNLEKLMILYYTLHVDLNRLVGDDTAYDFIRQEGDEPVDIDYRLAIRDLMVDIVHTNGSAERKKKVMEAYYAYGEMLATLFDQMKPNP